MEAALIAALISGVGMYAVGTHAQDQFAGNPAMSYYAGAPQTLAPASPAFAAQPAYFAQPMTVNSRPVAAPPRTVYRATTAAAAAPRPAEKTSHRSWTKTAMVIGGTTAGSAGVGGLIGGKKGALIGAALGGGAASIYEATHR
jgi:hypothetical protein